MTAHEMVLKLDDEAQMLADQCVRDLKRKDQRRAQDTLIKSFWQLRFLAHSMLSQLARREEELAQREEAK